MGGRARKAKERRETWGDSFEGKRVAGNGRQGLNRIFGSTEKLPGSFFRGEEGIKTGGKKSWRTKKIQGGKAGGERFLKKNGKQKSLRAGQERRGRSYELRRPSGRGKSGKTRKKLCGGNRAGKKHGSGSPKPPALHAGERDGNFLKEKEKALKI